MTWTLVRKLLRDIRLPLAVVALLLLLFQGFWVQITARVLGELSPYFVGLASASGQTRQDVEDRVFKGSGRLVKTVIGGERLSLDRAMDMLSIGYVHPLMQTVFCIWAIGRAAGAIAGEIDRGTMELLLSQPLARARLVAAHLLVDLLVLPVLCLSLIAGTALGSAIVGPIVPQEDPDFKPPELEHTLQLGPLKYTTKVPLALPKETEEQQRERLAVHVGPFFPGLLVVGGLMFAVSGATMWLSSMGRYRWRVTGLAVFVALVQFLVNLLGQLWEPLGVLRPLTLFYYFQPQQVVLHGNWFVTVPEWHEGVRVPMLAVLYGVGAAGYALALWTFRRRDLPAPL